MTMSGGMAQTSCTPTSKASLRIISRHGGGTRCGPGSCAYAAGAPIKQRSALPRDGSLFDGMLSPKLQQPRRARPPCLPHPSSQTFVDLSSPVTSR